MSRIIFVVALGGAELLKIVSLQSETIPPGLWEIAKDFPVLILFLGSLYYLMRWGERMLDKLFTHLDSRQTQTDENIQVITREISALTKEILVLRGTVSEVAKVDDVIDQLFAEIRKNKAG